MRRNVLFRTLAQLSRKYLRWYGNASLRSERSGERQGVADALVPGGPFSLDCGAWTPLLFFWATRISKTEEETKAAEQRRTPKGARMTAYRSRLEQIRQAFPQPVSNPVHDSYFVHSILRALDAVDSMKSDLPVLGKVQPADYAAALKAQRDAEYRRLVAARERIEGRWHERLSRADSSYRYKHERHAQGAEKASAEQKPPALKCPRCGADMAVLDIHGVSLDECTGCKGLFFDRGEMEELFLRKSEDRRSIFRRLAGLVS